jgi:hypothetical protein
MRAAWQKAGVPPESGGRAPQKIAVFRALQLGDMLCAVPAWRALRAAFPRAEIILIGLPWAREFAERFAHYFDSFVEFPGYPGLPEIVPALDQLPGFLSAVQAEHFDLAIQMHGCGTITNPLVASFGARDLAGFYKAGQFRPDASRFLIYPEELPETWRHLRLMEHLGIPLQREELEFPLFPEDWVALERIPEAQHLEAGGYVHSSRGTCGAAPLAPGALRSNRRRLGGRGAPDCAHRVGGGGRTDRPGIACHAGPGHRPGGKNQSRGAGGTASAECTFGL